MGKATDNQASEILSARVQMVQHINDDIYGYTGQYPSWAFTQNLFFINFKVWHEFVLLDEKTLYYAVLLDNGVTDVVSEIADLY